MSIYKLPLVQENTIVISDCILISYIFIMLLLFIILLPNGFPGGTCGEEPTCQCRLDLRDMGSIPGSGRSPGGGHGIPLQYSCLENPMDRGANWATVQGVAQSQTQLKQLSTHAKHNLAHAT